MACSDGGSGGVGSGEDSFLVNEGGRSANATRLSRSIGSRIPIGCVAPDVTINRRIGMCRVNLCRFLKNVFREDADSAEEQSISK